MPWSLLNGPVWLTGLRQNAVDRSNLALQNAGDEGITLRVTVFSGDSLAPAEQGLPRESPWVRESSSSTTPFSTHRRIRARACKGRTNQWCKAPYYAYAVINDQANSDGSFVFPVREDSLAGKQGQTLPVIVETEFFNSELTVANVSAFPKILDFSLVADAIQTV